MTVANTADKTLDKARPHADSRQCPSSVDQRWTALDNVPTSMDQKVWSIPVEVWVGLPEPSVGVFTTAGTSQGRLRRHFVIRPATSVPELAGTGGRQRSPTGKLNGLQPGQAG